MKKLRARFEKKDRSRYISHLDLYRFMQRTFRRARISVWYTQGFNPHLYIMFPLPLSLGYEGECEIMDFNINDDDLSAEEVMERLNAVLPQGVHINEVYEPVMKHTEIAYSCYDIELTSPDRVLCSEKFAEFMNQETIVIQKKTKQKTMKDVDIKPFADIKEYHDTDKGMFISMNMPSGSGASYNPSLLLSAFYKFAGSEAEYAAVNRTAVRTEKGEDFR